jgi:hypothetical protein
LEFLSARFEAGNLYEVLADYAAALQAAPRSLGREEEGDGCDGYDDVVSFYRFVNQNGRTLVEFPMITLQQVASLSSTYF